MIVIKLGGDLVKEPLRENLFKEIAEMSKKHSLVIVHGGGDEVTEIAEKLGHAQKFIYSPSGIKSRYTDSETVRIYAMVMSGLISKRIALVLNKYNVRAVTLSGIDGRIVIAERKKKLMVEENGRKFLIEGGYTGIVRNVDTYLLYILLEFGYVPVLSPIAIGYEGEMLNIDSDRFASSIAASLSADYLIFLTDVEGVFINGKLIEEIKSDECEKLINEVGQGMKMKLLAALQALKNGVKKVIITSGLREDLKLEKLESIERKTLIKA